MEKKKQFTKEQLLEMLLILNDKVNNISIMSSDNNHLISELMQQNKALFKFISNLEVEEIVPEDSYRSLTPSINDIPDEKSYMSLRELVNEFMGRKKDLVEFEKELKKHKDQLTPGQVGEA